MWFYFMNYLSLSLGNLNSDTDELYLLLLQCPAAHIFPPQCFLLYGVLGFVSAMSVIWNIVNKFSQWKKIGKGSHRVRHIMGAYISKKKPGHPSPQLFQPAEAHSPGYSLMQ